MPIRREFRWLYPIDWPQLSAIVRFEKAKGRWQQCQRNRGKMVCHLGDGRWWDAEQTAWRNDLGKIVSGLPVCDEHFPASTGLVLRSTRVVLATAHLDHNPGNSSVRNLKALCQRCHMINDRPEHRRRRFHTLFRRKALGDLFLGRYTPF